MTQTLWIQVSLAGGLAIALLVLAAGIRRRRNREWLIRLSSKYSPGVVEAGTSREARQLASLYEDDSKGIRLGDTFVGSDDQGRYFAAERRRGRRREHVFFFEPEGGTHLRGFSFSLRDRGSFFALSKLYRKRSRGDESEQSYSLSWTAPRPQWKDEKGLAVAARILFHAAQIIEESPLDCLHLSIEQRRVLVRCDRRLSGAELDRFLADATALRRRILESLRRVQAAGSSSGRPVSTASPSHRSSLRSDRVKVLR